MTASSSTLRDRSSPRPTGRIEVDLPFTYPYDWQSIILFYQAHSIPGVERVMDDSFARAFRFDQSIGFVRVRAIADKPRLKVWIMPENPQLVPEVLRRVRKMFDLDCAPALIARSFASIPLFARLYRRFPGLRLPGGWDAFETAVCAILGQLVSAPQRASLIGQLVSNYGEEIVEPSSGQKTRLFPGVETLARSDLSAVRTTVDRREAIREFSRRVLSGAIALSDGQDPAAFRKSLRQIRGLGAWSAEYISLRAIGDTDAFPKTDLILKRVLELHPDLDLARLQPWRSYAAIYLWKQFAETLSRAKRVKRT